MLNKEDKAIAVVSTAVLVTGMILTPIAGIWPALAIGGGIWMTGKCLAVVEKVSRRYQ